MKTTWKKKIEAEFQDGDNWGNVVHTMTEEELNKVFNDGYGGSQGCGFTVWSDNYVYFPVVYDGAEWVGYSCYIWNIEKIIQTIKALKGRIECFNILGGPEISVSRASSLSDQGIGNFYVIGEGEKKIVNLVRYLMARNSSFVCNFPKGIAYRNHEVFHYIEDKTVEEVIKTFVQHLVNQKKIATFPSSIEVILRGIGIEDFQCLSNYDILDIQFTE